MQRILYEISSSNYYPVEFQDIWHVPCIQEKWKYGCCYQKIGYLPNSLAYTDKVWDDIIVLPQACQGMYSFNESQTTWRWLEMVKIWVLCGWRFSHWFDIVLETPYSCDTVDRELYVTSYTLFVVVLWNWLENSLRKASMCVYLNWF